MCESLPDASVDQNATIFVHFSQIHRRAFHFWIGQSELRMNIVDIFQEICETSTGSFYGFLVTETFEN